MYFIKQVMFANSSALLFTNGISPSANNNLLNTKYKTE